MTQAPGYSAYRRIQTETASSAELIVQLYDGLLRYLRMAELAFAEGSRERSNEALVRSQAIVLELITSLNADLDSELPGQLASLYEYMHHRLVEANTRQDASAALEVHAYAQRLRDAWAHAVREVAGSGPGVEATSRAGSASRG